MCEDIIGLGLNKGAFPRHVYLLPSAVCKKVSFMQEAHTGVSLLLPPHMNYKETLN
jgi:hypothetical protein